MECEKWVSLILTGSVFMPLLLVAKVHCLLALWEGDLDGMCISGAWNQEKL